MREVIRCAHCALNQFMTVSGKCRKCHKLFVEPDPALVAALNALEPATPRFIPLAGSSHLGENLPPILRMLREACGYSQKQLAARLQKPRTYISKYENGKALPTVKTLFQLAIGLDVPAYVILQMAEAA